MTQPPLIQTTIQFNHSTHITRQTNQNLTHPQIKPDNPRKQNPYPKKPLIGQPAIKTTHHSKTPKHLQFEHRSPFYLPNIHNDWTSAHIKAMAAVQMAIVGQVQVGVSSDIWLWEPRLRQSTALRCTN